MNKRQILDQIKGKLIVSCQALEDEPLHGSVIMGKMAVAAFRGGAAGIRSNSTEDITEIRKQVPLPVIGLIKRQYADSLVYITPTMKEVEALVKAGAEIIATDATDRPRPAGQDLKRFFEEVRSAYPNQLFMADCATFEECLAAQEMGFDLVGSTLRGYTEQTEGIELPDMDFLRQLGQHITVPVIAEGGIWTPQQLKEILGIPGIHAAVIGSAITRPLDITRRFVREISPS